MNDPLDLDSAEELIDLLETIEDEPIQIPLVIGLLRQLGFGDDTEAARILLVFLYACPIEPEDEANYPGYLAYVTLLERYVGTDSKTGESGASGRQESPTEDAYILLGVSKGCSREELKAAYYQKVKEWHPDSIQHMAPELRAMASERLGSINVAYKKLTNRA